MLNQVGFLREPPRKAGELGSTIWPLGAEHPPNDLGDGLDTVPKAEATEQCAMS